MEVGQRVADTFKEQSILVTGASGFLGKVLVEKLLYSTPELKNIYLLIRPQGGLSPKKRLDKILQGPLFDRLRTENPSAFSKLVPIGGNLLEEDLGLSQPDMHRICEEVGIVFHCAATVKFDEALRLSIEMNVVVHASTAYANCDKSETVEAIYPPPIPPNKLLNAIDWMDDNMLKAITPHLLAARPNTYTLTKALAEVQLAEDARMLPLIIVRPSIIGAMWREPLPGWTDNINGPTGIFAACGKGLLTNMCGNVHCKADIVPVDVVSNMLIVAAAYRATSRFDKIPVMHCCSGELNPIKWKHIVDFIKIFYRKYPLNECYRVPSTHFHSSRFLFELNFYYKHLAPAYFIDFICRLTGRKQQFVRIYGKVWRMVETLHYFTTHGWNFESKGLLSMWDSLCDEDKEVFNFDVRQLDWNSYLFDYLMGVKRYVIKERLEDIPKATRNLLWLKLYSAVVNAGFWWLFVRTFARRRMKKTQWGMWAAGFALTYIWSSFNFGERVHLKSLEEYKRTTHCC
uniref:Fatty acyl-CoA reductase n=1 Tax=Ascaris lumbricoides TaxID=6252 RepID=A0A9J2P8L0_ASCLU